MTGDLTPAPQMPEDVADRHSDRRRNVIINHTSTDLENIVNGHDPDIHHLGNRVWDRLDKMAVEIERHAIEAQAAENADLRAKLAEVTALLADAYGAEIDWDALLQERGAGTFAQGIEAALKACDVGSVPKYQDEFSAGCRHAKIVIREAIRALTPPVDAHETPIRCHQAGLTTAGEHKPCPFCGSQPKMIHPLGDYGLRNYRLACSNDRCCTMTWACDTAEEAEAQWATRAPQADPVREAAKVLLSAFTDPDAIPQNQQPDWQSVYNAMKEDHAANMTDGGLVGWPSVLVEALRALADERKEAE